MCGGGGGNPSKQSLTLGSSIYQEKSKISGKNWFVKMLIAASIMMQVLMTLLMEAEVDIESSDCQHISDFVESCSGSSDSDWF